MLNHRQRAFAEHFAACGNATEAARKAGYSKKTARQQGDRLLSNAAIQKRIAELTEQLSGARIADAAEVKMFLTDTLRSPTEKTGDRIKAGMQLLRAEGKTPPAPPQFEEEAEEDAPTANNAARIMLPYCGNDPATINAFLRPDGQVVPFAGHERDDLLIFTNLAGWRETDHNAVDS